MSLLFELAACALVNDNDLHVDAGNLHMPNGEDDELDNKPGHECSHKVKIHEPGTPNEGNCESVAVPAGPDQRTDVEVEIHEPDTPNEGNVESMVLPARPDQHIDVESILPTSANNPDGEGDPTNGELAARVKFGSKIGLFEAGTSVTGIVAVFNNSGNYHEKSLSDKLLLGASLLFTLISFVFGVVLLQGCPFFHLEIFPMNNPKSIGRIKFVTGVALVSITMVMIFGSALIIRRAY